jgi:hypothetical protein
MWMQGGGERSGLADRNPGAPNGRGAYTVLLYEVGANSIIFHIIFYLYYLSIGRWFFIR